MKTLVKRIFGTEKKEIKKIGLILDRIKKNLILIQENPNKVQALVDATILSWFCRENDLKKSIEKMVSQKDNFTSLCEKLYDIGAYDNRVSDGSKPSSSTIYLGNVYGIWTFSAQKWLSNQSKHEKDFHPEATLKSTGGPATVWQIINDQAKQQLRLKKIKAILCLLEEIRNAA